MDQSKENERKPSPSLAIEPPKRVVTNGLDLMLKQKMETPASNGTTQSDW
jgi:hypothetical protein